MLTSHSLRKPMFDRFAALLICALLCTLVEAAAPQTTESTEGSHANSMMAELMPHPPANEIHHTYTCPMHPEVQSSMPGRCPECGMFLVAADDGKKQHDHHHAIPAMQMKPIRQTEHKPSARYTCPMHPEVQSSMPGRCPECGMFLVAADDDQHQHDSHHAASAMRMKPIHQADHEPSALYACPMHPEVQAHQPGRCPECGMFLVKLNADQGTAEPQTMRPSATHDRQPHTHTQADNNRMQHRMPMPDDHKSARYWETDSHTPSPPVMPNPAATDPGHANAADERMPAASSEHTHAVMDSPEPSAISDHAQTYICPMHPQIVSNHPGDCPICGMNLVQRQVAADPENANQVYLEAAVIQRMGMRTARVSRSALGRHIRIQGTVTPDDDRMLYIHPRTGGWIEKLYLTTEGDRVERKEELADFYSPWINQAQLEFINALEAYDLASFEPDKKSQLEAEVDARRNALRLLNVPPMDVMRIEKSRKVQNTIQIMAPQGGWITELNVREGTYIEPYESMFTIVDLSRVWVMTDIYEHQAPWVRKGQQVRITTPAIPGRHWNGAIDFIYPEVNPKTRTLRARIEVDNPDEALLLNMFVEVDLSEGATRHDILSVPREAVILTGEREIVVKSLGKGHFQSAEVVTGVWGDDRVEILSGLAENDEIVVSGQFLIDSESSLRGSLLRMAE